MRQLTLLFGLLVGLAASGGIAQAADLDNGRTLHQGNCVACHASLTDGKPDTLYTRPNRLVTSLPGLHKQVRRCEQNLGLRWFDDEITDVAEYLNKGFYHFQK